MMKAKQAKSEETEIAVSKKNTIIKDGIRYFIFGDIGIVDKLESKVYTLEYGMTGIFLREADDIVLPETIYSNDKIFIDHVLKSYEAVEDSVGVLLSGKKV